MLLLLLLLSLFPTSLVVASVLVFVFVYVYMHGCMKHTEHEEYNTVSLASSKKEFGKVGHENGSIDDIFSLLHR